MRISRTRSAVRVPATSGNVGPGFDAMGLALDLTDELVLEATTGGVSVEVEGEGSGAVPDGEDHLVVRALRLALDHVGAPQIGVRLHCVNRIPHGRGLGSSAAATVAGLMLARGLIAEPEALSDDVLLELATVMEGHPDNAAPAILGGVTVSWTEAGRPRTVGLEIGRDVLDPVVLLPRSTLATDSARSLLPAQVPHADAAANVGRAALLVHALAHDRALLLPATEDHLHQDYRSGGMPESVHLVHVLRQEGYPAVVSGAGPSVLVLAGGDAGMRDVVRRAVDAPQTWRIARMGCSRDGAVPVVL